MNKQILIIPLVLWALTACQTNNKTLGGVIGGVAGGLLGKTVGSGAGNTCTAYNRCTLAVAGNVTSPGTCTTTCAPATVAR